MTNYGTATDLYLIAPDGTTTLYMKAERIAMTVVRSPIVTDVASNFMITVEIGKQKREFVIDGYFTTDQTNTAKTLIEQFENASINWWSLAGAGGDTANPPTSGPSGKTGVCVLVWGQKSDGTTWKRYDVVITNFQLTDSPLDFGSDQNKYRFTLSLIESGNSSNNLSTSG